VDMTGEYVSSQLVLEDLKAYRNAGPGLLVVNSENVVVQSSFFSDNRASIDLDHSGAIVVQNSEITGLSDYQMILEATQPDVTPLCPGPNYKVNGIEMHSFTRSQNAEGLFIDDVKFSGFKDVLECKQVAISFRPLVSYMFWVTFS